MCIIPPLLKRINGFNFQIVLLFTLGGYASLGLTVKTFFESLPGLSEHLGNGTTCVSLSHILSVLLFRSYHMGSIEPRINAVILTISFTLLK